MCGATTKAVRASTRAVSLVSSMRASRLQLSVDRARVVPTGSPSPAAADCSLVTLSADNPNMPNAPGSAVMSVAGVDVVRM